MFDLSEVTADEIRALYNATPPEKRVHRKFYAMAILVRAGYDPNDLRPLDADQLAKMVER